MIYSLWCLNNELLLTVLLCMKFVYWQTLFLLLPSTTNPLGYKNGKAIIFRLFLMNKTNANYLFLRSAFTFWYFYRFSMQNLFAMFQADTLYILLAIMNINSLTWFEENLNRYFYKRRK